MPRPQDLSQQFSLGSLDFHYNPYTQDSIELVDGNNYLDRDEDKFEEKKQTSVRTALVKKSADLKLTHGKLVDHIPNVKKVNENSETESGQTLHPLDDPSVDWTPYTDNLIQDDLKVGDEVYYPQVGKKRWKRLFRHNNCGLGSGLTRFICCPWCICNTQLFP